MYWVGLYLFISFRSAKESMGLNKSTHYFEHISLENLVCHPATRECLKQRALQPRWNSKMMTTVGRS